MSLLCYLSRYQQAVKHVDEPKRNTRGRVEKQKPNQCLIDSPVPSDICVCNNDINGVGSSGNRDSDTDDLSSYSESDASSNCSETSNKYTQVHSIYYRITSSSEPRDDSEILITRVPHHRDDCSVKDISSGGRQGSMKYDRNDRRKYSQSKNSTNDRCIRLFQLSERQHIEGKKRRERINSSKLKMNNKRL